MKKNADKKGGGKSTKERKQAHAGSGINMPVTKAKVPQVDMKQRYGKPSQTQKM